MSAARSGENQNEYENLLELRHKILCQSLVTKMLEVRTMSFAEELKAQQLRLKISQERLAEILDVSPRTVWKWLQGEEPLKLTQEGALARLNKRLGIFEANVQDQP